MSKVKHSSLGAFLVHGGMKMRSNSYARVACKILKYLNGYVRGVEFMDVTQPKNSVLDHPRNWYITSQGIQYLEENSLMQKAYKVAKETRDWLPLI